MKRSGERLEDVSIKSVTDTEIIYVDQNGTETTIPKSEVSAILYDNGRYEEIKSQAVTSMNKTQSAVATSEAYNPPVEVGPGAKEYNVCAYGVYALLYVPNSKYDGTVVEYRIIYKGQNETPEFKYLGTTPFAYLTEKMYNNNFTAKGDPNFQNLKELNPFVIENAKDVKKVEFRLSLDGYKTVIVKPVYDAFVGGGPVMFIPLQNLKPLKEGEANEVPEISTDDAAKAAALEKARMEEEQARLAKEQEYQDGQIHRVSANSWYYIDKYYTKKRLIVLS